MKLYFLGTGSQKPSRTRNVTSIALILDDSNYILFDCGEGTQHQILRSNLSFSNLNSIFITHLHGDHIFGLQGLLCSLNETFEGKELNLYGPKGIYDYIKSTIFCGIHGMLQYKLNIKEFRGNLNSNLDDEIVIKSKTNELYFIQNFPVTHTPIEQGQTYGYVIKKNDQKIKFKNPNESGIFNVFDRNKTQLNEWLNRIPNKQTSSIKNVLGILQSTDYELIINDYELGTINFRTDSRFLHNPKKGKCICLIIDNCNADRAPEALKGNKCDTLVHECTNSKTSLDKEKSYEEIERETIKKGHSTPNMAGKFAKMLKAEKLILTHFSSRYKGDEDEESLNIMEEIRQHALDEFKNDNVVMARDFMEVEV